MSAAFILWAMRFFENQNFAICGKTVGSVRRNIINPLLKIDDLSIYYELKYNNSDNFLTATDRESGVQNIFYVFGGKDEGSAALIQGLTLAGAFLDEVALMPRSFVEQALARCSIGGSKFWFNCNPESPGHWFYKEWILKADDKKALRLHFEFADNPTLTEEIKERYRRMYADSIIFYNRFVKGLWVAADGLVYDIDLKKIVVDKVPERGKYYISIDYGTQNPFSMGLWCVNGRTATRIKEYYYNGRKRGKQKTDEQYYQDLEKFAEGYRIEEIVVDPSAASFIALIRDRDKFDVRKAKNDVNDGIRVTAEMLNSGAVKIHSSCEAALEEFTLYHWDSKKTDEDRVVKENDHAMDDIRYFCYTIFRNILRWDDDED